MIAKHVSAGYGAIEEHDLAVIQNRSVFLARRRHPYVAVLTRKLHSDEQDIDPGSVDRSKGGRLYLGQPPEKPDSDVDIAARLGEALQKAGATVAVAESSAGGRVAAALLAVPGASRWFTEATVLYEKGSKHRLLGIPEALQVCWNTEPLRLAHTTIWITSSFLLCDLL